MGGEDVNKTGFCPDVTEVELHLTQWSRLCVMSDVAMCYLRIIDIAAAVGTARRSVEYVRYSLLDALTHPKLSAARALQNASFVAMLCTVAATKQSLVKRPIGRQIYPVTLWPTDGVTGASNEAQDFVDGLIVPNADLRYSTERMESVSELALASIGSLNRSVCA